MLRRCLERLVPHVDRDQLALTGGVALAALVPGSRTGVADVDFVARRMDAVRPSVTREFLVSHYHAAPDRPIVQLVDPETRLRIDVFPDRAGAVARATVRDVIALSALCDEPLPPAPSIAPDVYRTNVAYVCARCERSRSPDFPIAPKPTIFAILGYV